MRLIATLLLSGLTALAFTAESSAAKRHRAPPSPTYDSTSLQSLPLTVNRRSWLDPGPVAPKGTGTAYVAASTQFAKTQDRIFSPDGFGNDVIQGQPYVPGRTVPIVSFSTTKNNDVVVDNVLGPQNYYFNPAPSLPARNSSPFQNSNDVAPLP